MRTRGQVRQQTAHQQDVEQHKSLFLKLAAESRLALTQLGSVLNQRNEDLEQQLRDARRSIEDQRGQHVRQTHTARQTLVRVDQSVVRLTQQLNDQRRAYEAERGRADSLQQETGSRAEQTAALRRQVETLQLRLREQETTFSQASTRFLQNERAALQKQEQLQTRLDEQGEVLERERARFQQQETNARTALTEVTSSLNLLLPQVRSVLDAYEPEPIGAAAHQSSTAPRPQDQTFSAQPSQNTSQCLDEQHSTLDQDRAQAQLLVDQASDALTTHQDISRRNLARREEILSCPISLDLFDDPVTTSCCGKTFSSESLRQALARNSKCPVCRARRVSTNPNRDMAALVELHRSERTVLGLPDVTTPIVAAPQVYNDAGVAQASLRGNQRIRRSNESSSRRSSRQHQEHRSQRAEARSAVAHRRRSRTSTTRIAASSAVSTATLRAVAARRPRPRATDPPRSRHSSRRSSTRSGASSAVTNTVTRTTTQAGTQPTASHGSQPIAGIAFSDTQIDARHPRDLMQNATSLGLDDYLRLDASANAVLDSYLFAPRPLNSFLHPQTSAGAPELGAWLYSRMRSGAASVGGLNLRTHHRDVSNAARTDQNADPRQLFPRTLDATHPLPGRRQSIVGHLSHASQLVTQEPQVQQLFTSESETD